MLRPNVASAEMKLMRRLAWQGYPVLQRSFMQPL
jgi:hypothetical protein